MWASIKVFGANAFRDAVAHGVALAEHAERLLRADPTWEVVTPARLGIVTLRAIAPGASVAELDALNASLPSRALLDGFTYLSTTLVDGKTVLRMCTINPRTEPSDIECSLARLARLVHSTPKHGGFAHS